MQRTLKISVQDIFREWNELAVIEQPKDTSDIIDDDEEVAETVDQFVIQNMYTELVGGDDDGDYHDDCDD